MGFNSHYTRWAAPRIPRSSLEWVQERRHFKETLNAPLSKSNIETRDSTGLKNFPEISCWGRRKAGTWYFPEKKFVSQGKILNCLTDQNPAQ